jgi:hypothetical protein
MAEAVTDKIFKMGFQGLIVISKPPYKILPVLSCSHGYYEKHLKPVLFFYPYERLFGSSDERERFFLVGNTGWYGNAHHSVGALKILDIQHWFSVEELACEDYSPPLTCFVRQYRQICNSGYFMQDMRQHVCPTKYISIEKGIGLNQRMREPICRHSGRCGQI